MNFIFLTFLCISTLASTQCYTYKCDASIDAEYCAITSNANKTYTLRPCENPKVCDFHPENTFSSCVGHVGVRYPGEYCKDYKDCISGNCTNDNCEVENDKCSTDAQCSYGYYCNETTSKCSLVKKENDDCTTKDKCDSGLACGNGKCVKMGSLEVKSHSLSPGACKSFYTYENECAESPKLKSDSIPSNGPVKCNNGCKYSSEGKSDFESSCSCGYINGSDLYCNPGIGDIEISDVILSF